MRRLEVPVFLLEGRFDHVLPPALAAQWWNSLDAPCKRLVWFEASAHNPPFEQPTQFTLVLSRDVRRAIRDNDACQGAEVTHVQD